jgi:hypothetical protein
LCFAHRREEVLACLRALSRLRGSRREEKAERMRETKD